MRTPPITPPASDGLEPSTSQQSTKTTAIASPATCRNTVRFLQCSLYSDEDASSDDEGDAGYTGRAAALGWLGGRQGMELDAAVTKFEPKTTTRRRRSRTPVKESTSPSRFIVKGTVTPSRAAPLFQHFSRGRRNAQRQSLIRGCQRFSGSEASESSEEDEENMRSSLLASPSRGPRSPSRGGAPRRPLTSLSPNSPQLGAPLSLMKSARKHAALMDARCRVVSESSRAALPPLTPIPTPACIRPRLATADTASLLLAMRSNSVSHLPYASSFRGAAMHSANRGVLGAAGMLGAGGRHLATPLSHTGFYRDFQTSSTPRLDLFTLPSSQEGRSLMQPICAEYANSARCLSLTSSHAQWLAVGSNEGTVTLIDTASDECRADRDEVTPSFEVSDWTVFEVKWRYDDEIIATGSSDYRVKLFSTSTLQPIRNFAGPRGSTRSIAWDPSSCGHVLVSGGRDGAIHMYDMRVPSRGSESDGADGQPVVSLWGAHATGAPAAPRRGRKAKNHASVKGVTSLTYVPSRGSSMLCSAGCGDGVLKLWDMRALASTCAVNVSGGEATLSATVDDQPQGQQSTQAAPRADKPAYVTAPCGDESEQHAVYPLDHGLDVTRQISSNKSPHGVSSIAASSSKVFAASTDGCIYSLSSADLMTGSTTAIGLPCVPLYDASQRGNSLYARLALQDDERMLALGNASGTVSIWDTHAASLAAAEMRAHGGSLHGERSTASAASTYFDGRDGLQSMARPITLTAHDRTFEVNSVSWAHGFDGPALASSSDDYTLRTWKKSTGRLSRE